MDASSFNWGLVPEPITIRITNCGCAGAQPGEILLDEQTLTRSVFGPRYAWGVVQHEFAHQVAWFLLDARDRALVRRRLGGGDWCYEDPSVGHDDHSCERFASTLAWAYWPSPANVMRPEAVMSARRFRLFLSRLLDRPTLTRFQPASPQM